MLHADVIVVGAGLAGLTCALELGALGLRVQVLESRHVVGGRTSSWLESGMPIESGLHRVIGFYRHLPAVLAEAGVDIDDIVYWEDEIEIRLPDGGGAAVLATAPLARPAETVGGVSNLLRIITLPDLLSLPAFFAGGLHEYFLNPAQLDQVSVVQQARAYGVTENAINRVLGPLTSGVFFLPPERYSAYAFFGLLGPYLHQLPTLRVGAFAGGMTEVMAAPLAAAIERNGGSVRTNTAAERLVIEDGRVLGVDVKGERLTARQVVVATALDAAQRLIAGAMPDHPWFEPMLRLPSMPAVSIQMELDGPAMPVDHTTFGPNTVLASFAEQSRTTFPDAPGRLSILLTPPSLFVGMDAADILDVVRRDADRLGLPVRDRIRQYRVVRLPADFYSLSPGTDALRPPQQTPVPGLTLAGDYTRQPYLATMEGAVASGRLASVAVQAGM